MKNILKIGAVIVLVSGFSAANAQTTDTMMRAHAPGKPFSTDAMEFVYMKNNTVMLHEKGREEGIALSTTFNCSDGSKVTTDGTFTRADGTVIKLGNGDKVFKDGHFELAN